MTLLRDYHAAIGEIIIKYSGTLERYAGDGVMVVFNDPVPVDNPALRAVRMALETREAMGALMEKWRELGHDVGFGIGIAHGYATLGTIGFEGRFDYAAIGTVSNVASRLCDEAKPGQILISARVLTKIENPRWIRARFATFCQYVTSSSLEGVTASDSNCKMFSRGTPWIGLDARGPLGIGCPCAGLPAFHGLSNLRPRPRVSGSGLIFLMVAGTEKAPGSLPQGLSLRRYTAWEEPEINPRRAIILARRWHGRDGERAAEAAPIVAAHAGRAAAGKATPLVS
jgi:Adenylate and Guanylate cyclase catalytic domain